MQKESVKQVSFATRTGAVARVRKTQVVAVSPKTYDYRERIDTRTGESAVMSRSIWAPSGLLVGLYFANARRIINVAYSENGKRYSQGWGFRTPGSFALAYRGAVMYLAECLELAQEDIDTALEMTPALMEAYFTPAGEWAPEQVSGAFYWNGWPRKLVMTSRGRATATGLVEQSVSVYVKMGSASVSLQLRENMMVCFQKLLTDFVDRCRERGIPGSVTASIEASAEVIENEVRLRFNDLAKRKGVQNVSARIAEPA